MNILFYFNDFFIASAEAIERNQQLEFERNIEKLQILKVRSILSEGNIFFTNIECRIN